MKGSPGVRWGNFEFEGGVSPSPAPGAYWLSSGVQQSNAEICRDFVGYCRNFAKATALLCMFDVTLDRAPTRPMRRKAKGKPLILTMQRGRAVRTCTSSPRRHTRRAAQTTRGCVRRALRGGSAGTTPSSGQRPTKWHPTPRRARQRARRRPAKAVRAGRDQGSRDAVGRRRIGGAA